MDLQSLPITTMTTTLLRRLTLATLACLAFLAPLHAQSHPFKSRDLSIPADVDPEKVKDAGNKAMAELLTTLLTRTDLPKKFAVLPLESDIDSDYFTMQLRNYFTSIGQQNGYELYTRSDDQWNQILNEIKWGDQYGDTMDPSTVQKFGRIQGVQALLMGRIGSISKDEDGNPIVRVSVQAFEVETGKQLWGDEIKGRINPDQASLHVDRLIRQVPGGLYTVAGGVVLLLFILIFLMRAISKAARPR